MTNAIFFNRMRGSGREVSINLIEAGIEITSLAGEPIAVWPYASVDLLKETSARREGSFVADHDEINLLQVFEPSLWDRIVGRAPRARRTAFRATSHWWNAFIGRPDQTVFYVWAALVGAIIWGGSKIYSWLFPS